MLIVFDSFHPHHLIFRFAAFLLGMIILGIGVCAYLQVHFPPNPIDKLMIAVKERFQLSLQKARIICDCCALTLAVLFQGAIGVGTIILTLSLGMTIQYFYPLVEKYTKHALSPKQDPPNHRFGG